MIDLNGRVAVISGAARGIGAATAHLFTQLGARVVVADLDEQEGAAVAAASPSGSAVFHRLDVSDADQWREVIDHAVATFGKLDILFNCAGIFAGVPTDAQPLDLYRRVIDINQVGTFLGIQAAIPAMRASGGGSIINVSSLAGVQGSPGPTLAYTASKFAVRGMTRAAAIEFGPENIRVNCLVPGNIDTPMNSGNPAVFRAVSDLASRQPIPRMGKAEECAAMVAFLASDAASFCTGADYYVDGGLLAGHPRGQADYSAEM